MGELDVFEVTKTVVVDSEGKIGEFRTNDRHENILTHLKLEEERRGEGLSREVILKWLQLCEQESYDTAFVINVNHGAVEHILSSLDEHVTKKVPPRDVPVDTTSGPHISDICYKIFLN